MTPFHKPTMFARGSFCPKQRSRTLLLSRLDQVDTAGLAKVFLWRKVGPVRWATLSSKKGETTRRQVDPSIAEPTFVCHVNGLPSFIRRWTRNVGKLVRARGNSGRRVTLLRGTTFLNINGTLGSYAFQKCVELIKHKKINL